MLWEETVPLMQQGYHKQLAQYAYGEGSGGAPVYPLPQNVFDAMRITTLDKLKVVIIGQDPYFNAHPAIGPEAHGLCFSVKQGVPVPPSLRNIFKEINNSIYGGSKADFDSDLTRWAEQGFCCLMPV